jgi:two-component system CheB/CheR fusion protein
MPTSRTNDNESVGTRTKVKKPTATTRKATTRQREKKSFPVVGLGASAGGLNALKSFFGQVSVNSGMAYIVVVHHTPKHPSMMAELLQKVTPIPVKIAEDDQYVAPDHIYVIPPDKEISMYHGNIQLLDVIDNHAALPIDTFFKSLAQDQGARAVAVILSGTGTDGTLGIKEIKAADGLVLVQSEDSAEYDGMPRSAINSGAADMVLPSDQMPQKLTQYYRHQKAAFKERTLAAADQSAWLNKIFAILRTQIGHDFSQYKLNTLLRRISRRMGLNQIDNHNQYIRFLRENPSEGMPCSVSF